MLPENLEGTVLENDLMILRRLGEGGMGVVYARNIAAKGHFCLAIREIVKSLRVCSKKGAEH